MHGKTYKLKRFTAGRRGENGQKYRYDAWQLTVPSNLGRMLRPDQEFTIELTSDGILYRPIPETEKAVPAWVKQFSHTAA